MRQATVGALVNRRYWCVFCLKIFQFFLHSSSTFRGIVHLFAEHMIKLDNAFKEEAYVPTFPAQVSLDSG